MKRNLPVLAVLSLLVLGAAARADSLNGLRSSVARVGDVNADGVPDLAVASRDRDRPERVWIVSGRDGARLLEVAGEARATDPVASAPSTPACVLDSAEEPPASRFGTEIGVVGDWDRDGVTDFHVAARDLHAWDRGSGYRRIVSGRTGATLKQDVGSGAVGGTHDLDQDGFVDLLLVVDATRERSSAIAVVSGRDGSELLRGASSNAARVDAGPIVECLAWLDDVDRDGRRDFASARSRTVQGAPGANIRVSYEFAATSGRSGLVLWTASMESHESWDSASLVRIDDANGDGIADVLYALEDRHVRLLDGRDGTTIWRRELPRHAAYSLGSSLDRVGDVDDDGSDDWVIAANESWSEAFDAGLCFVASGRTGETIVEMREDANFGFDACGIGDVDGDGVSDFAVGAERQRGWTPDDSSEPAVQVRSGKDASILWMRRHVDLRK